MYSIYFRGLFKTITPSFLRKEGLLSYLYSIAVSLQWINTNVMVPFREKVRRLVVFDGTTIMLEKLLNDQNLLPYDPNTRTHDIGLSSIIYIENKSNSNYWYNLSEGMTPSYMFNASENETPYYLFNESESPDYPVFVIWIPNLLGGTFETASTDDNLITRKLVDTFRLAGMGNYLIKRY